MTNLELPLAPHSRPGFFTRILRFFGFGSRNWHSPERCAAFTSAFVALAAKMAKADGVAVAAEAETFEQLLDVEPETLPEVRRLYAQAKQDTAGYEIYADRVANMLANDPKAKRRVFESLFLVACSDGILHPAEDQFLQDVAHRFGYDGDTFQAIRATFVQSPDSPYAVLGVAPDASMRAIKARYRKLMAENHPDRLIAQGAPAAVVTTATAKAAAYNAAFDQIEAERRTAP